MRNSYFGRVWRRQSFGREEKPPLVLGDIACADIGELLVKKNKGGKIHEE